MAYKEPKLSKEAAVAFYNGLNTGFDKKKKSGIAGNKSTAKSKSTTKGKKK